MADMEEMMGERDVWVLLLIQGIVAVVIGTLLLVRPGITTVVLATFIGWYWIITGFISILMIAGNRQMWGLKLAVGLLGVFAGFAVVSSPLWSTAFLLSFGVIMLGVNGLITGAIEIWRAFKGAGWGQGLLGVLNLVIGVLLLANVFAAAAVLPFVYGILGVGFGLAAIIMAFRVRKLPPAATA